MSLKKITFFNLLLCWVFVSVLRLTVVAVSWGLLFVVVHGLSLRWLLLVRSQALEHVGFSSCGAWA